MRYRPSKLPAGFSLAFSDDGTILACGGRRIHVIDVASKERICLSKPTRNSSHIAISANNHLLAVKNTEGCIVLASAKSGAFLERMCGPENGQGCGLHFVNKDQCILDGSWKGRITVRRIADQAITHRIEYANSLISEISFAANCGRFLALIQPKGDFSPETYSYIELYDAIGFRRLSGPFKYGGDIQAASLSWDGHKIAIARKNYGPPFRYEILLAESADGKIDAVAPQCILPGHGCTIAWSRDSRYVFVTGRHRFLVLDGRQLTVLAEIPVEEEVPYSIATQPNTELIALGTWSRTRLVQVKDCLAQTAPTR